MRYLLVDRVTSWERGATMVGVKNVTMSEDFLEFHFPRFPVMPGSMILEALVQLTGWLEAASSDFSRWFLLEQVKTVKYYGFALPGDQIELRVEAAGEDEGLALYKGLAQVEGERKVVVDFAGRMVDLKDYEDPAEQAHLFKILNREITLS
ncbi:MAG: beta-hydroxyacyl-ACP dehydratase [Nitrospinaceae bacterium]|nr:beta-hydroxyacyl-ACP dehydratase [Nitrospinaceae bacterium]MBT4430316.1 beta-hydroxyacyl-ACP dehydratase [Nitrospinaceae bacterium]MBT5948669.1 beta-hydroxyacyl-ACP dehydratase [Nitrospinaceae bacterium]